MEPSRAELQGAVDVTVFRRLGLERRLRTLPGRCRRLLLGLDNDENDAALVFQGLPYADVIALAGAHPEVRRALAALRTDFDLWA